MEIPGKGSLDLLITDAGDRAGQVRLRGSLKETGGSPSEQAALEASAKEFEGVFLNTLLKAMRQTVPVEVSTRMNVSGIEAACANSNE